MEPWKVIMENDIVGNDALMEEWRQARDSAAALLEEVPALSDILGMDTTTLNGVYKKAYEAFSLENFEEAENLFTTLFLFDAGNPDYQIGLAASLEAQEKFREAVSIYALAQARKASPHGYYRMGKCFMGLEDRDRAVLMFQLAGKPGPRSELSVKEKIYMDKAKKMVQLLQG